jgi:predicted ATP-grasp superfamily ATP-dependent carboligase
VTKAAAVVLKLDSITGLQTARILSDYGIPVTGIVDDPSHFCARTNCCEEIIVSSTSEDALLDTLTHLYEKIGVSVIFPCSDESVSVISRGRERLAGKYRFVLPGDEVLTLFMNKKSFYKFALDRGLSIPATLFPAGESGLDEIAEKFRPPYVVKPAVRSDGWTDRFRHKVLKLDSVEDLRAVYSACLDAGEEIIVQEWIDGDDSCLCSSIFYYGSGSGRALMFTSRKLRQWRTEVGDACLAEEWRDDETVKLTEELLAGIKFRGIGSIEFKKDRSTGRYYIIEANIGRPVTRIGLVEKAGVPILYAMYCDALGLPLPPGLEQRYTGAKWISLINDILSSFTYYRKKNLTVREWLRSLRGVKAFAVLSLRDPMPFLFQPLFYLRNYMKRPKPKGKPLLTP